MSTVLVLDDDPAIRTVVSRALTRAGHAVELVGTAAALDRLLKAGRGDVLVTDVALPDGNGLELLPRVRAERPGLPVIVISAQSTLVTAVRASERGAFEYLPKPFDLNDLTAAVRAALEQRSAVSPALPGGADGLPLIGRSPAMQDVYRVIARVVGTGLPVMILGESGTGKELVARALHDMGPRAHGPFVAVNMAAIPKDLIESELFGHERGSFTGATATRPGRFEQAEGGTLFLDEIGDMPIEAQTRLLRVVQSGEFTSVGGARPRRTDVRLISATNKELNRLVADGGFREDLYYRLNVVPIELPPLRDRAEDIPELARHFLAEAARAGLPSKSLTEDAAAALQAHRWPGNVRELENIMRRLAALAREDVLTGVTIAAALKGAVGRAEAAQPATGDLAGAVAAWLHGEFAAAGDALPMDGLLDRALAEIEPVLLRHAMAATEGNQIRAARLLGVNRNTLRKRLTERGINPHAPLP